VAQGYYRRVAENRAVALDTRRLAWMGLGDSQRQMKQWGQALLAYRAAKGLGGAELLGQAMAGYSAGCVLIELKQYKEAINELRGLRFPPQAEPLPSLALLKLGECYEQMNRWREAVPIYTRLTRVAPERERGEARERLNWIEQNIPKEMRS
jgi:tetratricopeptide (TPR) repeat protein